MRWIGLVVAVMLLASCPAAPKRLPPLCGPEHPEYWDNRCRLLAERTR